jgi:hypothetical protein
MDNGQSTSRIHFGECEGVKGGRGVRPPLLNDTSLR